MHAKMIPPDFSAQIGSHILKMSDDVICGIISPVSDWLLNASKSLLASQQERFWQLWERLNYHPEI
jgi:hypothetical protein